MYLNEVQAVINIEDVNLHCLLDSGSETNLIGVQILNKYIPNWRGLADAQGPEFGIGASGHQFKMLATKLFKFSINGKSFNNPMLISDNMEEVLLGLPFLKSAHVTMTFSDNNVDLYVDNILLVS